jgi:hypothetical protein
MPLPDFLISANMFVCERVLHEQDGIQSAIRIVDVFYIRGEINPPDKVIPIVQTNALAIVKSKPGHMEEHELEVTVTNTAGETTSVGKQQVNFTGRFPDLPGGVTMALQLNVGVRRLGTCYLALLIDGEQVCRTAFTLMQALDKAEARE